MPCLIQQLFRSKIGQGLEPGIVDEVLFHLLRPQKHPPQKLLIDIRSLGIIIIGGSRFDGGQGPAAVASRKRVGKGVPTFTAALSFRPRFAPYYIAVPEGKLGSKLRRQIHRVHTWGSIDIINGLRELKYPGIGYKPRTTPITGRRNDLTEDKFEGVYIRLGEEWVDYNHYSRGMVESRSSFVNNFLEDAHVRGKLLAWEGGVLGWEPTRLPLHPPFDI